MCSVREKKSVIMRTKVLMLLTALAVLVLLSGHALSTARRDGKNNRVFNFLRLFIPKCSAKI